MNSKLSIISLFLGIISLSTILVWIFPVGSLIQSKMIDFALYNILIAPLGLILGIMSFFTIKRNKFDGIWFAILGMLFSLIGILMLIFIALGIASSVGNFL